MSAGLLASTVTPGSTAPLVSLTTPAMPLACAHAVAGAHSSMAASADAGTILRIGLPPLK